ncbi:MAG: helix-turn-helix domain-containing protein [Sphingobium sp.]|jgi:excisionase family DNA binding protein|nr:MAG: helix-turn-helix domain-containing protein [Sphingobium sp.]
MTMFAHRQLPPSAQDAAIARVSGQLLSRYARQKRPLTLRVTDSEQERPLELPAGAVALLMDILEAMAAGRGVTLMPENAELTTVQAAEVLNVSRPFLIKLLDEGAIPHRKVGKHRRIRMEDVMAYKAAIDRERETVLDQLVSEAQEQEQDMGYHRP